MKRKHGFTLVELLVVIGIIALLISILLPSLAAARFQAGVVRCSAQMHSVFQGVQMYANDNKGYLPPAHYMEFNNGYTPAARVPFYMANADVNIIWTESMNKSGGSFTDKVEPGALLGRLAKSKYLSNTAKVFTCPVAQDTVGYQAVYTFNPHIKALSSLSSQPGNYTFWWNKLPNYGKYNAGPYPITGGTTAVIQQYRQAIMTDPMYDITNSTHVRGNKKSFNFAFADGSVQTYTTTKLAYRATGGGSTAVDRWGSFLDLSNAMQYSLEGGDVNWPDYASWNNKFNIIPLDPG